MHPTIEDLFSLKGRVIIITGGAGMLGRQHADILSLAGAHVVIADISQSICDQAAEEITRRSSVEAFGVEVDLSREESIKTMISNVNHKFGKIDILINNAVAKPKAFFKKFEEYPLDDWEQVMSVNLRGVFLCSKLVGEEMLKQGRGVIINIGSIYGLVGTDQSIYGTSGINAPAVYAASKGAVVNLTRYLATYWAGKNIRVNTLCPGGVENSQDPEFIKRYCAKTPLGRMAKKDDFRGAILFLCSDASSYMTGANLIIDGGWTAW